VASGYRRSMEIAVSDRGLTVPMGPIQIRPGDAGRLIVLVPYDPDRVAKIKTCLPPRAAGRGRQAVVGRRWHHTEKDWTVPPACRQARHTEGVLAPMPAALRLAQAGLQALLAEEPVEVEPSLRPVRTPDHREPPPEPEIRHAGEKGLKLKRLSDDDDLHPCAESRGQGGEKPDGRVVNRADLLGC
jgi:hypothetical protein